MSDRIVASGTGRTGSIFFAFFEAEDFEGVLGLLGNVEVEEDFEDWGVLSPAARAVQVEEKHRENAL